MADTLTTIYGDLEDLGRAEGYLDEILEIIDRIRLFDDLALDEIRVLCRHMRCYAAPRNYALLEAGAGGGYLLLVLTGTAEVRRQRPGLDDDNIEAIAAGAALGEASLVDGQPCGVSCIATVPTDFAVLTRDALNHILLQAPRLGNKLLLALLQLMSARLRRAERHMADLPVLAEPAAF